MFSIFGKANYESISVHDLDGKLGKINLIDVREIYEYKGGHVPTAKNISMGTILASPEKHLNKTTKYHIIANQVEEVERPARNYQHWDIK